MKLDISEYYSDFLQSCCNLMLAISSPSCVIQDVMFREVVEGRSQQG